MMEKITDHTQWKAGDILHIPPQTLEADDDGDLYYNDTSDCEVWVTMNGLLDGVPADSYVERKVLTAADQVEALPVGTRFIIHYQDGSQGVHFRSSNGYSWHPEGLGELRVAALANNAVKIEVLP